MSISIDKALSIHAPAMALRAERSQVLANNLANADTPGYKARDLDFKSALAQAAQAGDLRTTNPRHMSTATQADGSARLLYRVPSQPSLDGNTVEANAEQARFSENAMRYEASLSFLERRVSSMRNALKGSNQ